MNCQPGEVSPQCPEINRLGEARIAAGFPYAFQILEGCQARDGGNLHVREMPLFARPVNEREAILLP